MANVWLHNEMLQVEGKKMSKSLGNIRPIGELLEQYPAEVIRFFVLSTHYRRPIDFSDEEVAAKKKGLGKGLDALLGGLGMHLVAQGDLGVGDLAEFEAGAAATVVDEFGEGVRETAGADVVNGDDGVVRAERPAGVDHLLPRAVVTGGTGTGAVGVDIVLGVDFRPVRHGMTVAAGVSTREIISTQGNRVGM